VTSVVASAEIGRPASDVFAYATDPRTFHEWQKGVVAGHLEAGGAPQVGARCVTTRRIGFATRPLASEIVALDPPRRWVIESLAGPIRAHVEVTVDALADDRSRLTIVIAFAGRGIGRAVVPLFVVPEARREMPENLAVLRRRLEDHG
jgi:hypothetical protein